MWETVMDGAYGSTMVPSALMKTPRKSPITCSSARKSVISFPSTCAYGDSASNMAQDPTMSRFTFCSPLGWIAGQRQYLSK